MKAPRRSVGRGFAALLFCALMLSAGARGVWAQYRVNVYNPQVYSSTRQTMSDRAAARAALKRKRRSAAPTGAAGTSPASPATSAKPSTPSGRGVGNNR